MSRHDVDGLSFDFPDDWQAGRYDDWSFYRNQFARMWNGIKAIDLLAVDPQRTAWLIEVKDYRIHQRTKPSELAEEMARKVFDTLAAILPAKLHAPDRQEQSLAKAVAGARAMRVVLHLEQPAKQSKLRPVAINPADVKQKIRQLLKPIDAHPMVVDMTAMDLLGWSVQ